MNLEKAKEMLLNIEWCENDGQRIDVLCDIVEFLLDEIGRIKSPPVATLEQLPDGIPLRQLPYHRYHHHPEENAGRCYVMQSNPKFIKIQPSSDIVRDENGKIVGIHLIFRPNSVVADRQWCEANSVDAHYDYLCIQIGSDQFPIGCVMKYRNPDELYANEIPTDEQIVECFKFCCGLLGLTTNKNKTQDFKDMLLRGNE